VLARWHRYSATGCHGRQEKLGLRIAVIVIVRVLVLRWWWPSLSLSNTEARGSLLLLEWGGVVVVAGGASVGCCIDIRIYLVVVECGWVTHIIITAGELQMVIVSGALTSW